jgi:hypothetical protein
MMWHLVSGVHWPAWRIEFMVTVACCSLGTFAISSRVSLVVHGAGSKSHRHEGRRDVDPERTGSLDDSHRGRPPKTTFTDVSVSFAHMTFRRLAEHGRNSRLGHESVIGHEC